MRSWDELTPATLRGAHERFSATTFDFEKLSAACWRAQLRNARDAALRDTRFPTDAAKVTHGVKKNPKRTRE